MKRPVIAKLKKIVCFKETVFLQTTYTKLHYHLLYQDTELKYTLEYANHHSNPDSSHNAIFKNKMYKTRTHLAGEVWKIKEQNGQYNIKWSIVKHFHGYNPVSKSCMLCTNEKLHSRICRRQFD